MSIIDQLPNEILLKILSYLNTHDLMNFCTACGNSCFLRDRALIRSVDFSRRFELQYFNLFRFITTNLNCSHIKILNVNYLHWIPAKELRILIQKLENLEILFAIDTELGLEDKDIHEYVKLKKLAVTLKRDPFHTHSIEVSKKLKTLNSLCLKILFKQSSYQLYEFFEEIPHLEELWIFDEDESFETIDYSYIVNMLKNLKKLVIKSKIPLPYHNFEHDNLFKTFECRRNGPAAELIFERLNKPEDITESTFQSPENEVEEALEFFKTSLQNLPCGPAESKKIYLKQYIPSIYFEELNFCHPVILCNSKYISAAYKILSSKNSAKLRRLRLRSCLFQTSQADEPIESRTDSKRLRKETKKEFTNHPFLTVAGNFKNLRELEIESCPVCSGGQPVYLSLHSFENLRKLTLEIPPLMEGLFLKEVFIKCRDLESLNLTCVVQNEKFISGLRQNLKYAPNLRDFRLDNKTIIMDKLLDSLLENKKLMRIFIKCEYLEYKRRFGAGPMKLFQNFFRNNPQLILCVIVFKVLQNRTLLDTEDKPPKIYCLINVKDSHFMQNFPNTAHSDILFSHTDVSGVNIDDF